MKSKPTDLLSILTKPKFELLTFSLIINIDLSYF